MVRVLRGLRVFNVFDQLRLLLKCVVGSLITLFWSSFMLAFTLYLFSVLILTTMAQFGPKKGMMASFGSQDLVDNFGSVEQSMLSLFVAVTGGADWKEFFDVLPEVHSKFLFMLFIFFFHITILNVLTGLYVDNAMKHARPGRESQAKALAVQRVADYRDLDEFCRKRCVISEGSILDRDTFRTACADQQFVAYLATFGINASNPDELFSCLQDLGISLTLHGLVEGLLKLRDPATNYDVERAAQGTRTLLNRRNLGSPPDGPRTPSSHRMRPGSPTDVPRTAPSDRMQLGSPTDVPRTRPSHHMHL